MEADRGCSVAANGQLIVDYEDEFDDFGDSKCSLCQRRFEEQGKGTRNLQIFEVSEKNYRGSKERQDQAYQPVRPARASLLFNIYFR